MYGFRYRYHARQRGVRGWGAVEPLFANGEQGLWLDPSDLSTLFQDTAGTSPLTAPGQQVALALDKSGRGGRVIQPTALARPTLGRHPAGGTRNLLLGSEGQRGWTAIGTSPPAVAAATHLGKPCWGVTFPAGLANATWNVSRATYPSQTYPFPGAYSWNYKVATNRPLLPGETVTVMLNGSFATAGINLTSADNLTQWVQRSVPNIVYAATLNAGLYPAVTNVTTLGEPLTVYITDMQMEAGSTITPYQRVASAWDVTEDGKRDCWYLGFDGVDDFMVSAAPLNLSASDKLTMWAGLEKRSDAVVGVFFETSTSIVGIYPGSLNWVIPAYSGSQGVAFNVRGSSAIASRIADWGAAPRGTVMSCVYDIAGADQATEVFPRINGAVPVQTNAGNPSGTGNFGTYTAYLGMRGGATLPFNGRLYGLVIRGGVSDAGTIAAVEAVLRYKIGAAP